MAESDVSAVKVFNYICSLGGFAEFSQLLKHPSPLAKKSSVSSVVLWFEKEKMSGSFDSERRLVMTTNQYGRGFGIRIDLRKQMCLKYTTTETCKAASRCKFWHICKEFMEGTCKGKCGRSHDFHDEDNKGKVTELGFENKSSTNLRSIVAGSLPQVCLSYLKGECVTDNCPYLHICSSQVRATSCECSLSHHFANPHNKNVLKQFGLMPPRTSEIDVVRCNILVPKQQRPVEDGKRQLELAQAHQKLSQLNTSEIFGKSQISSKVKGAKPVTLAGLIQEESKLRVMTSVPPAAQQDAVSTEGDPLFGKVFNYLCGKGGLATLPELLQHPSPLAKKFSTPGQEQDAMIWLRVQAQPDQNPRISLLENGDGEVCGIRVKLKKKLCLHYASKGSCAKSMCPFWHICKGYLEGKCSGHDCGLSHDFCDEGNIQNVQKLGLEKRPSGAVKNIVANSLPQVCLKYLKNECLSSSCPYLHVCCPAAQGNWCTCSPTHDLRHLDAHNMGVLRQCELVPQPSKLNIVYCNILIPKQQRSFDVGKVNLFSSSSSSQQSHLNKFGPEIPSLMSMSIKPELQGAEKSSQNKRGKAKKRTRRRNRKTSLQGKQAGEGTQANTEDIEEDSSDSVSDNEDMDKPDLYSSSKFAVNVTKAVEENLINLSDDDWQGVDASVDDFTNSDLLSQVDEMFFDDWFGPSSTTGSLSQASAISSTSDDPNTGSSERDHLEKSAANSVFECICKEHNGQVPFSVISKHQELFPPGVIDIADWFRKNQNRFMVVEDKDGEIEAIRAYHPRVRICFSYLLTKKGCKDPKCFRYHVCNRYLANGVCPFGDKCRYSHSHNLRSPHNRKITSQLKLKSYSEEQLRILIAASVPEVCLDYNKRSCQKGLRCSGMHICKYFVMKHCKKGDECPLGHESILKLPHAKLVLDRYHLAKVPARAVLGALLVREPRSLREMSVQPQNVSEEARHQRVVSHPPHICLDHLLGHCSKEPLCDHFHCTAPYMWQYKDSGTDEDTWKSFTPSNNEAIEQQFCDVNVTVAGMEHIMISPPSSLLIDPGDGEVMINFEDMKAVTSFGEVQLRRLSTKSAVLPTDHALSTQWVWHWLDENGIWRQYGCEPSGMVKQEQIESMFVTGKPFFRFKGSDNVHKIFFHKSPMCQQNTKPPISTIRVRRRPVFRSASEIERLQRPLELPIPMEPESPSIPAGPVSSLPPQWTSVPDDEEYIRIPLPASSDQYKLAESLFRQSMSENKATIVAIERVQNLFMWEKYARKKEQLEKRFRTKNSPVNEKLLFHGADPQNVDSICEENIDWRAVDEGRAALFGQGAYFTAEAALSNAYCKPDSDSLRYLFLAEVLVGLFAKGEPSMKRPPQKSDSTSKKESYDSCVDNVERPTIYVLFDSDQYYPTFLIRYKMKSKVVC